MKVSVSVIINLIKFEKKFNNTFLNPSSKVLEVYILSTFGEIIVFDKHGQVVYIRIRYDQTFENMDFDSDAYNFC